MKQLTIRQAINTLKRCRSIKPVYWNNGGCGCMFTQICRRRKLIKRNQTVSRGGDVYNAYYEIVSVVPFHDEFWDISPEMLTPEIVEMTRAQAIAKLEAMLKRAS